MLKSQPSPFTYFLFRSVYFLCQTVLSTSGLVLAQWRSCLVQDHCKNLYLGKNNVDRGSVSIMLFNQNSTEPQAIIKPPTCATDNPCYRGVECRDTREGPRCGRCPDGYVGDGLKCKPGITCNMRPCFAGKFFYFWKFISHSLIVTTPAGRFPIRASSPGYPFIPNPAPGRIRLYHDVMSDDI